MPAFPRTAMGMPQNPFKINPSSQRTAAGPQRLTLSGKFLARLLPVLLAAGLLPAALPSTSSLPDSDSADNGAGQCAACHQDIASRQLASDHAHTMMKVEDIPELMRALPVEHVDQASGIAYRMERSSAQPAGVDLVARMGTREETLRLLWGVGAGRKGITFIGRSDQGAFGQSRVSWYQKIEKLDVTTGLEKRPVDAYDALAGWLNPHESAHCLSCHMTRNENTPPDSIPEADAGVHCERCHGSGEQHIRAMAEETDNPSRGIDNPGRLGALEQIYFCGACHGIPPGGADLRALGHAMAMDHSVRFPAERLVLSRCYNESGGRLKCTTCHDPHENLAGSFDRNCLSCHGRQTDFAVPCPQSNNDCVSCHMPQETGFMTHSAFADHWIRVVPASD